MTNTPKWTDQDSMDKLTPEEQQQVDTASENYEADYFNKPEAKGPLDHFKAGVQYALQHLLPSRMKGFVEYCGRFYEECDHTGKWIDRWSRTKIYTTEELIEKYIQHLETIKNKEDGVE